MKTLSQDLLTRRESSPDKKTFWDTIRIESRESPSRYKKALQDILSMSPPLSGVKLSLKYSYQNSMEYTPKNTKIYF